MTPRERWLACMRYEPLDHIPDQEFGYWDETFPAWHVQGLPVYVDSNWKADIFFGFETHVGPPLNNGLVPGFESRILEEDERHTILIDHDGVKMMIRRDGGSTIPHYIKFPIETREDWENIKKRLDPASPERFASDEEWSNWKNWVRTCDRVRNIYCGSLFGKLRDWMGFENIAIACMDDPAWVEEMIDYLAEFNYRLIERMVREVEFDQGTFWEDMAFNHGPIISPKLFEKWLVPRYEKLTRLLNDNGCEFSMVDCDGNIMSIYHLWVNAGVNIMFPLEIRGGSDPYEMREKLGKKVRFAGGVDKTQLIAGKDKIDKEIERIRPLVEDGGFIPHVDHRCPPDVTYENYLYYLKRKRETFGIPEPEPWEKRRELHEWAKA